MYKKKVQFTDTLVVYIRTTSWNPMQLLVIRLCDTVQVRFYERRPLERECAETCGPRIL